MRIAHSADIDVVATLHSRRGDDDLDALCVVSVCNRMIQDANASHNLSSLRDNCLSRPNEHKGINDLLVL